MSEDKVLYVVGYNMVGYLPESEPFGHETWESARQDMIDTLDRDGDFMFEGTEEDKALADELTAKMEDLNLDNGPEWSTIVGNMSYWITVVPADEYEGESCDAID